MDTLNIRTQSNDDKPSADFQCMDDPPEIPVPKGHGSDVDYLTRAGGEEVPQIAKEHVDTLPEQIGSESTAAPPFKFASQSDIGKKDDDDEDDDDDDDEKDKKKPAPAPKPKPKATTSK
jgi:hypothetical protein